MESLRLEELCRGFTCITKLIEAVSFVHAKIGHGLMTNQQCVDIFQSIIEDIPLGKTNLPELEQLIAFGSTVVPHESISIDGIIIQTLFCDEDDLEDPEFEVIYEEAFQMGEIKSMLKTGKSVFLIPQKSSFLQPPIEWVSIVEYHPITNVFIQLGGKVEIPCDDVDLRFTVVVSAA